LPQLTALLDKPLSEADRGLVLRTILRAGATPEADAALKKFVASGAFTVDAASLSAANIDRLMPILLAPPPPPPLPAPPTSTSPTASAPQKVRGQLVFDFAARKATGLETLKPALAHLDAASNPVPAILNASDANPAKIAAIIDVLAQSPNPVAQAAAADGL